LLARRHIFEADGEHTHHRLMRAGLSHRGAVLALWAVQAVFVVLGCSVFLGRPIAFLYAVALE
jgi:UDP-GlcNAc:undecaprenyl-phosphate GlcNAc-1-phosphate transferase